MPKYLQIVCFAVLLLLLPLKACKSSNNGSFEDKRKKAWKAYAKEQNKKRKAAAKAYKMHRKRQSKPMRKQMKKDVKKLRRDRRRNARKYG